eukprot:6041423-Pyramimonas_sp.AAC.1
MSTGAMALASAVNFALCPGAGFLVRAPCVLDDVVEHVVEALGVGLAIDVVPLATFRAGAEM